MSGENQINKARLMVRLKHFNESFPKSISEVRAFELVRGEKLATSGVDKKEFEEKAKAALQSVSDSIESEVAQRLAIAKSNMETTIIVAGRTMSVAEALIYRKFAIEKLQRTIGHLSSNYSAVSKQYMEESRNFSNLVREKTGAEIESLKQLFEPSIAGPVDTLTKMSDNLKLFISEIDAALTESNALTVIQL